MKRFIDTGSLVLEDSLDQLVVEARVEEIAQEPVSKPVRRDALSGDGSDLDWISLEEEVESEPETLDTISDDEFSRLSHEFFIGDDDGDLPSVDLTFDTIEETEDMGTSKQSGSSSGLFLLDELLDEERPKTASTTSNSDPFIDFVDLEPTETAPVAIVDRLKNAFDDEEQPGRKKRKKVNLRLPDFKTISRHALVAIVSAFWLIVFVLAGLFLVDFYDLDQYLTLGASELQPTSTVMVSEEQQSTDQPEVEEEIIEPTVTPTALPPQTSLSKISRFSLENLIPLETYTQPYPMVLSADGEYTAVLDLRTVHLLDVYGEEMWKKEIMTARAIGGGFSEDNSLLGIFCDDMTLKIWNVVDGEPVNEVAISPEMEIVYDVIPYLPQNSKAAVQFSADNMYVAAGYWGGVTVWSVETGSVVHEYALAQSILANSFDASYDLSAVVDFHPSTPQIVYGIRENIYLVNVETNLTTQNWKTQYVGNLEWIDDNRVIEAGYPLNSLDSYLAVWQTDNLYPMMKENCLAASRGFHLPHFAYFGNVSILVFETKGASDNKVNVKVLSLLDGLEIGQLELDTYQPLLGMIKLEQEGILGVWAQIPKEGFGVSDQIQFWDLDTFELIAFCPDCSFVTNIQAGGYELFINDDNTLITQYQQGIGTQQLGIPKETP
ncbi:MAG: hypothetical protein V2J07_05185 [Anaerolineae bacterium]|nr:hypothetical protein [Anaerolineae bacterium]